MFSIFTNIAYLFYGLISLTKPPRYHIYMDSGATVYLQGVRHVLCSRAPGIAASVTRLGGR